MSRVELHLPEAQSLKDRRAVLKSLKDRLRGKFNVAVAEVDTDERWQRACLGMAAVGSEPRYVEGLLNEALNLIRQERRVAVIHVEQERW